MAEKSGKGEPNGEMSLRMATLAKERPDLALELGLAAMEGGFAVAAEGRALCERGLEEYARRGGAGTGKEIEALARLSSMDGGPESWGESLGPWARKQASKILPKLSMRGLETMERSFPGIVADEKAPTLSKSPLAVEWLGKRGKITEEKALGLVRELGTAWWPGQDLGEAQARAEAAEAAWSAAPEACARAWRKAIGYGVAALDPQNRAAAMEWLGNAARERVCSDLARECKKPDGDYMGAQRIAELAQRPGYLVEAKGAKGTERMGKLFRELGKRLAREGTEEAWKDPWGGRDLRRCSEGMYGSGGYWGAASLGALPCEWLFSGFGQEQEDFGEAMALEWWRGWKEGGGPAPKALISADEVDDRRKAGAEALSGPEAIAALLRESPRGREAARWLLLESGWASEAGLDQAARMAERMGKRNWRMSAEREAVLEGARLGLAAAKGKAGKPKAGL